MAAVDSTESPETETPSLDYCILLATNADEPVRTSDVIYGLHGICVALEERLCNLNTREPIDRHEMTLLVGLGIAARNHAETLYSRTGRTSARMERALEATLASGQAEESEEGTAHA